MKIAFVCWRPFQVFNSINLRMKFAEDTDTCDIFIDDIPSLQKYKERIVKSGVFNNVYTYRVRKINHNSKLMALLQTLSDFIFCKFRIIKYLGRNNTKPFNYDEIIASGWDTFFVEMANANKHAEIKMVEDGTATYRMSDEREYIGGVYLKACRLIKALFHCGPLSVDVKCLYVNDLNMITQKWPYPVYEAPKLDNDVMRKLYEIFSVSDINRILYRDADYIFLGQPNFKIDKILDEMSGYDIKFVYRPHPTEIGSDNLKQFKKPVLIDTELPMWEIVSNELRSDSVLIGVFSTAQITPYIIYKKTPLLIFLYRILYEKTSAEYLRMQSFVEKYREIYPGYIFEPTSYEELRSVFKEVEESLKKTAIDRQLS